ncbi:ATP-dependent zinc protease [Ornithinimicrobium sp. LYQ103]|uniref:ATP-dependent zinc protease family protein n=1 Tax=Ornithinimicrobium sp. LYQ103 TaxID=3378796 RepID=UPI003854883C
MPGQTYETTPDRTVVGWREWVRLPGVGVPWIKAKIDTGARTSSLHAFDLRPYEAEGGHRVRFSIHPWQATPADETAVDLPVHDERTVRSSSGHVETRYVVLVPLVLADRQVPAEVTLTDRDEMGFRMLVGREALVQGFVVDPSVSYAGGRPDRATRKKNWGR